MTVVGGGGAARSGLVTRIKNILLSPKAEWEVIDVEPATVGGLYSGYIAILALIPAVIGLIVTLAFASMLGSMGGGLFGASIVTSPIFAVLSAVVGYVLSLIMVYVLAVIIDALAPTFGTEKNRLQALKVAAYSATAIWVAAIALIVPVLGFLILLAGAVYTACLMYLGLIAVMKAPADKAMGYTIVTIIIGIVIAFVLNLIMMAPIGMMRASHILAANTQVRIPGVGSVDVSKMEEAAKRMEAASKQMADAANSGQMANGAPAGAIAPDVLQGVLPATLPGYTRSEVSSASGGLGGIGGTTAKGVYNKGDSRITVEVTDLGAMAAMANAFNVNGNKQTADGYEKVGKIDGRMTMEEYNRTSNHGSYGVMVADRYMVQAEGDRVTMDELKNAVTSIPFGRLEALSKG